MYQKFGYILLGLCSGALIIAANYDTLIERNPDSEKPYGRLLSNAYRVIVNHERQKGTFSNIDYFSGQANDVATMYNPRPLTTGGEVKNISNRRELRLQRFELERFMNGYAARVAADDVAMMHAAFDCRVKNIEINHTMDKQCQHIFSRHRNQANTKVDNYLNLNNQNIMPKPIEELPPQSTEEHEKETQKPIVSKEEAMIENVISPKQKEPQNFDNNNVLPVPVQPSDNQNSNNKPINGLVYPNSQDAPTEQPKVQPQEQPQAIPQQQNMKPKFNPLKYIHPSLRQKYLKQQKQEELQKQNLPTESQTPEKENNNFGIKPTSPMTVSGNEFGDNGLKQKLNFDPIQTASVNNSKVLSVRIPFSTGTLVTAEGRKQIEILGNAIKTGGYKNIQLIGHADKGNNNSVDIQMSLKRALHIKNILKNYDDMLNFNTQSVGSNQPISGLSHYDDRNRRVDILLR